MLLCNICNLSKDPKQTLSSVLFSTSRGFRDFFEHEHVSVYQWNCSILCQRFELKRCLMSLRLKQEKIIAIECYMTLYLPIRHFSQLQESGIGSEDRDVERLIKICLAFRPSFLKLYREVGVLCSSGQCLPHG